MVAWRKDPAYGVVPIVEPAASAPAKEINKRLGVAQALLGKLDPNDESYDVAARWVEAEEEGDKSYFDDHREDLQRLCLDFGVLKGAVLAGDALADATKEVFDGQFKEGRYLNDPKGGR